MWLGVDLGRQQRLLCLEEIRLSAENLLPILDSIVVITGGTYMTKHEFENLHLDCDLDNQLSFSGVALFICVCFIDSSTMVGNPPELSN